MKDFGCYRHVLFEDLKNYLNRNEYLAGFTTMEQSYIRKNIGAIGSEDIEKALSKISFSLNELSYNEFAELLYQKRLISGNLYIINDFQTIYQTNHINNKKFVSYGLDNHPSQIYKLICFAISNEEILPQIYIMYNNKIQPWCVLYNPKYKVLDDGTKDKGRIFYLQDQNGNVANYDFKNILFDYNDQDYYTFSNQEKEDNSQNCFNNDLRQSFGNIIQVPINRLICNYNGIFVNDFQEQDLSIKQVIKRDDNYYIDYLDIETLTHQFYAIAKNQNFIA